MQRAIRQQQHQLRLVASNIRQSHHSLHKFNTTQKATYVWRRITEYSEDEMNKIIEAKTPEGFGKPGQVLPIAVLKGQENPVVLPDSELPAWVFEAIKRELTLEQLENMVAKDGLNSLTAYQAKRLKKLKRRKLIKDNNYAREIGLVLAK